MMINKFLNQIVDYKIRKAEKRLQSLKVENTQMRYNLAMLKAKKQDM